MRESKRSAIAIRARVASIALVLVGLALAVSFGRAWLGDAGAATAPWWAYLLLTLLAVAMLALAAAVTLDPRAPLLRIALAGIALAWFAIVAGILVTWQTAVRWPGDPLILLLIFVVDGGALLGLAVSIGYESSLDEATEALGRFGPVVILAVAIVVVIAAVMVGASAVGSIWRSVSQGDPVDTIPWIAFAAIIVLPPLSFGVASFLSHRAAGGTFYVQAAANRRNTWLLLVALIGIVAATAEIITVSLTFDPVPALGAAAFAIVAGLGAAVGTDRFGSGIILDSAGARVADPTKESELLDVVRELSLSAAIPVPATYIVEDGSKNAFATGRDPNHAAVVVTRGLLEGMDREELQGVVGHELGHIRNLDTRYALYIAVFVGLVALVTDGFLQLVIEGWKRGAFFWKGKGKGAAGAFATGLLVGLFLLIVAALLRVFAPLFSALVQAATSREREFLADATSVEFTRNPKALERALTSLARDRDTLEAANRGTQHLWFRNPVKPGSDRRASWLSTHPSLGARIDRLRHLQGLPPIDPSIAARTAEET